MHPDKAKWKPESVGKPNPRKHHRPLDPADRSGPVVDGVVQTDPPKRYSDDPKDHEHPDLPLERPTSENPVVDEVAKGVHETLTKQERREKAADAEG